MSEFSRKFKIVEHYLV